LADSIARNGRVLYTNVIYWKALQEMAEAAKHFELNDQISFYSKKAEQVRKRNSKISLASDPGILRRQ